MESLILKLPGCNDVEYEVNDPGVEDSAASFMVAVVVNVVGP